MGPRIRQSGEGHSKTPAKRLSSAHKCARACATQRPAIPCPPHRSPCHKAAPVPQKPSPPARWPLWPGAVLPSRPGSARAQVAYRKRFRPSPKGGTTLSPATTGAPAPRCRGKSAPPIPRCPPAPRLLGSVISPTRKSHPLSLAGPGRLRPAGEKTQVCCMTYLGGQQQRPGQRPWARPLRVWPSRTGRPSSAILPANRHQACGAGSGDGFPRSAR
jgi:hypothetical protein